MSEQIKEILVIDDNKDFADECVEFIQKSCGVGAVAAFTVDQAIEKLTALPIKIILLDYDLTQTTGLQLFPDLKKIDPNAQIVFVSAVAPVSVLYEADKYPFSAKLTKSVCMERLPQLIPTLLLEYANTINPISHNVFFSDVKRNLFSRFRINYSIISYSIINKEYVFPDRWKTSQVIYKGETISEKREIDYEHTFELSENFQLTTGFETNFELTHISILKASLSSQLEKSIKSGYSEKIKSVINRMKELSLNDNNIDSSIVSRYYDFSSVYMEIKLLIRKECSCCNNASLIPSTVFFPVPKVKYRIREYYDGKEPNEIDSGTFYG